MILRRLAVVGILAGGTLALDAYQRYLVEEFADDYRSRRMSRRDLLRRVLQVTGSVPAAAAALLALGCGGGEAEPTPQPTQPPPTRQPTATPTFRVAEDDPAISAETVRFPGPASQLIAYLARPRAEGTYAGIIVIHENRGLVEHIKDVARRYAQEGFVALAVDLASRGGGTGSGGSPTGTGTADNVADLLANLAYLKSLPFVRPGALGVTGFCFGGGMTWELAVASRELKAAVPYYGTAAGVLDRIADLTAAVLVIYGGTDARITGERPQVEERLRAAGKTFEIKVYEGAGHAFFNDTGANYNAAAAADAWQATLAWFRRYLA